MVSESEWGGTESGFVTAAWAAKDMVRFMMHPQGSLNNYGYGFSPLERVISTVNNVLNADNFNATFFEEGSFPPVILQLMTSMDERKLEQAREYLLSELEGEWHKPAIMAGEKEIKAINLKDTTQKDMEFMEYYIFMARLLCAAYGLSGQDIGLTENVGSKNVAETQKDLTEAKGYGSVLNIITEIINKEILHDESLKFEDLIFEFVAEDSLDPQIANTIYDTALKNGTMTINEVRSKQGLQPYGSWADKPMIATAEGYKQIISDKEEEDTGDENKDDNKGEEINKSIYTEDGYKVYYDDRGYSQPFVCFNVITGEGYVIKPPVAVNLTSQQLEIDLTHRLSNMGLNVAVANKVPAVEIFKNVLETDEIRLAFIAYINMSPEFDSEKWRTKFGGSRKYPYYIVQRFVNGRGLRDPLLVADMNRDPYSYKQAIRDMAELWKTERDLVLGDRRADQYLITADKRAWGIDYQFEGDKQRWEDTKDAIPNTLVSVPELKTYFESLIAGPTKKSRIDKILEYLKV